jgi:hypothetical protein
LAERQFCGAHANDLQYPRDYPHDRSIALME